MQNQTDKDHIRVNIPAKYQKALTLSGSLETDSTRRLHYHDSHQILVIDKGVSLLVEEKIKQPLFGSMAAFIPSGCPHRSIVIGQGVKYKSIYLDKDMIKHSGEGIIIFEMSRLGAALFDHMTIRTQSDLEHAITRKSLDLFLEIFNEDIKNPAKLVRFPVPSLGINKEIVDFMETNFTSRLTMEDFETKFPYTHRHLSRVFKSDLNITIFDYLRLYRIFTAATRLVEKNATITEIVYECGFESVSSFYRDFKKVFGISPRAFVLNTENKSYQI